MARKNLEIEFPDEVVDKLGNLYENADKILGEMTHTGAEVAYNNIKANVPPSFIGSNIMKHLYMTRTYKTPTDGGINTKVGFYGYFVNHLGKTVPAPLVANVFDNGSSTVQKHPFLRKSFNSQVGKAMLKKGNELTGGFFENE